MRKLLIAGCVAALTLATPVAANARVTDIFAGDWYVSTKKLDPYLTSNCPDGGNLCTVGRYWVSIVRTGKTGDKWKWRGHAQAIYRNYGGTARKCLHCIIGYNVNWLQWVGQDYTWRFIGMVGHGGTGTPGQRTLSVGRWASARFNNHVGPVDIRDEYPELHIKLTLVQWANGSWHPVWTKAAYVSG